MTTEKLKEVLESKIASDEMNDFYVGKIIYKPNACGCININDSWFIYKKMDENCYLSLTGPFFENEIIYVLEVPDEEIIYFNSFKWDYIINYHYVPKNKEDLEKYIREMEAKGFSNTYEFLVGRYAGKFPLEERKIKDSWYRIFDIEEWNSREIQANLWEIKKEWVKCILKPGDTIPEEYHVR